MPQLPPPYGTPTAGTPPEDMMSGPAALPVERPDLRPGPVLPRFARSVPISLAILAVLGVIALMEFAASVFITVLSSLLIAMALEPIVQVLRRRLMLPRSVGSFIVVALAIVLLYGVAYVAYSGGRQLLADLPAITAAVREAPLVQRATGKVRDVTRTLREAGRTFAPAAPAAPGTKEAEEVVLREGLPPWARALIRGLGSLSTIAFSLGIIPVLVYFILAGKEPLTERTLRLFPPERQPSVRGVVEDIERLMRRFLLGNAVIALILSFATAAIFRFLGLPYGILLGILSGTTSVVPYLGLILALAPPLLVSLVVFPTAYPAFLVAAVVTGLHFAAMNVLVPKIVGRGVHLNAVTSVVALIFFGWLWGGMGLLLALPIVAVVKCILESVESTRALGQWMGNGGERTR